MPRLPSPLPKKGSGAFKTERQRVLSVLDLPRLCVVLEGALDRRGLEEVLRKALKGQAVRPGALPRAELVAAVADGFRQIDQVAFLAMRGLDKSCHRERHLVASMEEEDLEVRLSSYRAVDFKRERARLIWALLRDGRGAHAQQADRILSEAFAAEATKVAEQQAVEVDAGDDLQARAVETLKGKVETYEEAIHEQAEVIVREKSERRRLELERSELLVRIGRHKRAQRAEERRRKEAELEVRELHEEVAALKQELERHDPDLLQQTSAERDRLRDRARALERKAERAERIGELHEENEALRAELEATKKDAARRTAENIELHRQVASRERAAQRRVDDLRTSLKAARQLAASPTNADPSLIEGEPVDDASERVGVFLDASNISASARRAGDGSVDYPALLAGLVADRKRTVAVAFVVDGEGGSAGHEGFKRALQAAGWEVRSKQARERADGSVKADWDMGLAMEVLDARHRVDTIVLGSGDGDFVPLVRKLRQWGKRVEVASYVASTDRDLIRVADAYTDLTARFARAER